MTQDISAPIWRERIQLSHTIKDGWRVSEVTVECTYTDNHFAYQDDFERTRRNRLELAIAEGDAVAAVRNADTRKD